MAFVHGKNTDVYCNGYDLTAYITSIETPQTADTAEVSTFGLTSKAYIAGQKDATISVEGYYDGTADAIDDVLNTALGQAQTEWTWYPESDTFENVGYAMQTVNTSHNVSSDIGDATSISSEGQSIIGRERVISLHALSQESSSGSSSGNDNGASSSNGGSAFIHATDVTGTVEVIIEHDTDAGFATAATLASFTAISSDHVSERITFSGTVNRYVRATWTMGGGEDLTFQIGFNRI
jgi:hypothetical protein